MSDTEAKAPKKGKKKKILILGLMVLVLGGGGVGAGLYATGYVGGDHGPVEDPNKPHLVVREGVDPIWAERYASADGSKPVNPRKFQASYYPIADSITANLRDSDGYVQIGVGVSTYYDERVIEAVKLHEMAVKSAVLMTLSNQDVASLTSREGKLKLKHELKKAINDVLKSREGFGGIDDVYFTSFVVQ